MILIFLIYIRKASLPVGRIILIILLLLLYLPVAQYFRFKHAGLLNMDFISFVSLALLNYKELLFLLLGRLNMVEPFSRLLNVDTSVILSKYPFHNTFFPFALVALIPKFLYPTRPDSSIDGLVGYYLGYISDPSLSQVTVSILGEFWLNFKSEALLFVVLYAIYINYTYYKLLYSNKVLMVFLAIFFFTFVIFTGFESYFVVRNVIFLKLSIIYFMSYFLITRRVVTKKRRNI